MSYELSARATRSDLRWRSRGQLETNRAEQAVEIVDDPLVEPVELMGLRVPEASIAVKRLEQAGGRRGVDALERREEDNTETVTLGQRL